MIYEIEDKYLIHKAETPEGYQCKRTSGKGTDSWSGKRVWNTSQEELKPKLVFCKLA